MTLSIMAHNAECCYAEYSTQAHYAECYYTECLYAECRGAAPMTYHSMPDSEVDEAKIFLYQSKTFFQRPERKKERKKEKTYCPNCGPL